MIDGPVRSGAVRNTQAFPVCNEYEQQIGYTECCKLMQDLALGIPTHQTQLDMPLANGSKTGDMAPVIRAAGNHIVELTQMKFGFPRTRTHGPLFNLRSKGKHFGDSHRCLVPASAFFEHVGRKHPTAKHRFTLVSAPFMAIAAIWKPSQKVQPAAFTMLPTQPGPDVGPFHHRQVAVLHPIDWQEWINLTKPEEELL